MKSILFISSLFLSFLVSAQPLDTCNSVQFIFSGPNQSLQSPNRFIKNSDYSFIVATEGGDLRRLTRTGDTISLNDTSFNQIKDIEKLKDGNFIAFGNSKGFPSQGKMIKFDSLGIVLWSKIYLYKSNFFSLSSAIEIDSGNIVAAGTNGNNFALFKLNSQGDTLKVQEVTRRNSFGSPSKIIKRKNGNFILSGSDDDYPFAVGFNSNLDTLWSYYETIFISHTLISTFEDANNNIRLFAGRHNILLDSAGVKISDSISNIWYNTVVRMDTGFLGVGFRQAPTYSAVATRLSSTGDSISSFIYNDTAHFSSQYRDVIEIDSGCYAATGSITNSNNTRVGLLSYFGNCPKLATSIQKIQTSSNDILIYPNPNNGNFNIAGLELDTNFEIYDLKGRQVETGISKATIISTELNSGIYFIRLFNNNERVIKKLIVQ